VDARKARQFSAYGSISQPLLNLVVQPADCAGSDPNAARESIISLKLIDHGSTESSDPDHLRQSKNLQV
jgi:hypothetical protein